MVRQYFMLNINRLVPKAINEGPETTNLAQKLNIQTLETCFKKENRTKAKIAV